MSMKINGLKLPEELIVGKRHHLKTVSRAVNTLTKTLSDINGKRHIEIGSRIGASAIAASVYTDKIVCIDPMETLGVLEGYNHKDLGSEDLFFANMQKFGIEDKVHLIVAKSFPWPRELYGDGNEWDTAFVDGEHTFEGALQDLVNLRHRVRTAIILDDTILNDVSAAARGFVALAPEWSMDKHGTSVVLWRRDA